jgi:hypothetical protein
MQQVVNSNITKSQGDSRQDQMKLPTTIFKILSKVFGGISKEIKQHKLINKSDQIKRSDQLNRYH